MGVVVAWLETIPGLIYWNKPRQLSFKTAGVCRDTNSGPFEYKQAVLSGPNTKYPQMFKKILKSPKNSGCLKNGTQQVPYWESTRVRRSRTKRRTGFERRCSTLRNTTSCLTWLLSEAASCSLLVLPQLLRVQDLVTERRRVTSLLRCMTTSAFEFVFRIARCTIDCFDLWLTRENHKCRKL